MWPWYILAGVLTLGVGESFQNFKNILASSIKKRFSHLEVFYKNSLESKIHTELI